MNHGRLTYPARFDRSARMFEETLSEAEYNREETLLEAEVERRLVQVAAASTPERLAMMAGAATLPPRTDECPHTAVEHSRTKRTCLMCGADVSLPSDGA